MLLTIRILLSPLLHKLPNVYKESLIMEISSPLPVFSLAFLCCPFINENQSIIQVSGSKV